MVEIDKIKNEAFNQKLNRFSKEIFPQIKECGLSESLEMTDMEIIKRIRITLADLYHQKQMQNFLYKELNLKEEDK